MAQPCVIPPSVTAALEGRCDSLRQIDEAHPRSSEVSGVSAPKEGPNEPGREMEMDQIGVCDVGIPDEPPPEGAGEGRDDPGPQWLRVLLWDTPKVWVTCPAEQQPNGALWVGRGRKPVHGEPIIQVVQDISGSKKSERIRSKGEYKASGLPLPMITVSDVAIMLGVSRSTVEGIPATELPYANVSRGRANLRRRYKREDVEDYIATQRARSIELDEQEREKEQWVRAVSSASPAAVAGTSGSTTRERSRSTANRPTPPTKSSLANAWLKLKGS